MPVHRSKAVVWAAALFSVACKKDPTIATRVVTAHVPSACAASGEASALYIASGDFDPSVQVVRALGDVGASLDVLPAESRALFVDVTKDDAEWWALGGVPPSGDVDVLLWPAASPCALGADVGARTGAALGVVAGNRVLVVGGEPPAGGSVPATFVVDLATGAVTELANGLLTPRTRASVTAFGDGGLVAGGVRADGSTIDSAEVYVPAASTAAGAGDFDRVAIALSEARADHGAVVLATGETLLVGGRGANGPLASMEVVDPTARRARTQSLAVLEEARTNPTVLRLASGEILVAGGDDAQGSPVDSLEFLTPDAHAHAHRTQHLVARKRRAFAALPAGGALAVVAPDAGEPPIQNVWVVSADGSPEAATPIAGALGQAGDVFLFGGAAGAPVLWTGDRWLRWQPWAGAFTALAPAQGAPGPSDAAVASPDPGLAVWLEHSASTRVVGLRFDARSPYASIPGSLLTTSTAGVAPDRLVLPGTTTSIAYAADTGLTLAAGASVFVADTTYAAVAIDVDAPTGEPPLLVLRDEAGAELAVGGPDCPIPGTPASVHVERRGALVTANGAPCTAGVTQTARLSIGLRGQAPRSVAKNLRVARLP